MLKSRKSSNWTPRNGKKVKAKTKGFWAKKKTNYVPQSFSREEIKYVYEAIQNSQAAYIGTSTNCGVLTMPSTGTTEHSMIGNKCFLTGLYVTGDMNVQYDITTSPNYSAIMRLILVWDTQPGTGMAQYGTGTVWRDLLLEAPHIHSPFTHQKPRRFEVLMDEHMAFDSSVVRVHMFKKFIKLNRDYVAYDSVGSQIPMNGCIRFIALTTDNTLSGYLNMETKLFFKEVK